MQTLLSEHWHAVRSLRPRLREGVQPLHRRLRGKPWVLLFDPVTQRFHRMPTQVWRVLQLLDGQRTLDEVWNEACAQIDPHTAGSDGTAISQHELVQLMSSLHGNDLLQTQVSPDAGEVFERYQKQHRAKWKQSWLNPASLKLPLLYPDAWFTRHAGLARLMFSWSALAFWLAIVAPAAVLAWQHWSALTENLSDRVLSASNVVLLWFTYPVVKAVHEWAHGMAVKAFGGTVREMGLMFIVFTPVPYVDATSSYRFASKWHRATVAAAGIMAELVLGAVAVYVWLMAEPGLVTAIAFNVLLISGVSTVVVNGNPLMRYDGYYIFCDLLEVPNLSQRATQYWAYLIDRFGFGAPDATPPAGAQGERALLFFYGATAPFYRLAVSIGLIWFVVNEYLLLGVIMAIVAAWSSLVMPVWKGWKHLSEAGSLARRREQAQRRALVALGVVVLLLCAVPLPFHSVQQAVVWLPDEAIVRSEVSAHVVASPVASGQRVLPGQSIMALDSPVLDAELATARASLAQVQAQLRKAEIDDRVRAESLRFEAASRAGRVAEAQRRVDALALHAAAAGQWVPAASGELPGRYVKRGEVLGYVVAGPSRLVRTAVTQEDMDLIQSRAKGVQVRLASDVRHGIDAQIKRKVAGGEFDLVSPALGTNGGGEIAVDPAHQDGTRSLKRVFDVEVELERSAVAAVFGDRAYVRFDLGNAPLAWQWFLRLRQLFLARLNV
jgi:putative peptide zinc metalloprotease protein